jgi:[ribosomal protein S5]-alanine N-acetyltransferase
MKLLPIQELLEDNPDFINHPDCMESLQMSIDFYKKTGYFPPWIGYYVQQEDKLIGSAAFKGAPKEGAVEIAYGTFPQYQHQGLGTLICKELVRLALEADPTLKIRARTLPEKNYSTKILRKNGFELFGTSWDEQDGQVWEWEYRYRES